MTVPAMRQRELIIDGLAIELLDSEGDGLPVFVCHGNSSAADSFFAAWAGDISSIRVVGYIQRQFLICVVLL